uniref:Gnk2-homologous domain-containing protein n=1 Tax=Oryza brachyantha TaxID=4533 RepID=J3NDI3_ORYBR
MGNLHLIVFILVACGLCPAAFGGGDNDSRGYIPAYPNCSTTDNYTRNSQYQLNLNQLLNILPVEAKSNGGFYRTSLGAAPDEVFALIMCYSDRNWTQCENCLYAAANGISLWCPYSRTVDAVYDTCLLRYSGSSASFSTANTNVPTRPAWAARGGS